MIALETQNAGRTRRLCSLHIHDWTRGAPEPLGSLLTQAPGSGPWEAAHHSVRIGSKVQVTRGELGPLIDPDGLGMPVAAAISLKHATDVGTGEPLAGHEGLDVASVSTVYGEGPQAAAGAERVINDVRHPDIVGRDQVSLISAPRCGSLSRTYRLCVLPAARCGFIWLPR